MLYVQDYFTECMRCCVVFPGKDGFNSTARGAVQHQRVKKMGQPDRYISTHPHSPISKEPTHNRLSHPSTHPTHPSFTALQQCAVGAGRTDLGVRHIPLPELKVEVASSVPAPRIPVSYTHLTLPTICSV